MRDFLYLARLRYKLIRNSVTFGTRDKLMGRILLFFLALFFVAGDYLFFRRIIIHIRTLPDEVAELMIPQFLMVICLTFFSMLVFSNIVASISTFFLSTDLDLLMSSPINLRSIFTSRMITTTVNSSWMLFIFGVPIFFALGYTHNAGFMYYVGMVGTIIPFIIVPACLGILVTVLLMRFFPARKTHQFLTIVGLIFMGGLIMFFRFLKPEKFLGKEVPTELILQYVENLKIPDYGFLPSTWTARALAAGTQADFSGMALWVSVGWVAAGFLVAVNIYLVSRYYYQGWSLAYSGRSLSQVKTRRVIYLGIEKILAFVRPSLRSIILKDVKTFWRDPSQWTQLFMLGALVVVYIFNIRNLPMETIALKNFISVLNIALAGVVLAAVAVRFIFPTTSVEAKSFWIIKCSPVDFSGYLWGKFFFYLPPLLILAEILVIVSNMFLDVDPYLSSISVAGVFFITIGLTGLGIGLGAIFPVFDHENIAELATSTGAIYYMLISLTYIGIVVMFGVRPVWAHFSQKFLLRDVGGVEIYICYAVIIILTAAVTVIPIRMGAGALRKMDV